MTTQLAPNTMSLPPPAQPHLDLLDGNRLVGWVRGLALGFLGFANESEATGAAWVAYRTLARRLARRHGGRPAPIDVEPLSVGQDGDRTVILASGRPIATLVLPGVDSLSGPHSFGFEIQVPHPGDELSMRSLAYRVYRTLRKAGVRWAISKKRRVDTRRMAAPRQPVMVAAQGPSATDAAHATDRSDGAPLREDDLSDESMREIGWLALAILSITLLLLALVVPNELAVGFAAIGLAGLLVFRLTAEWVGWPPHRGIRVSSHAGPSAVRRESPTEGSPSGSNGARRVPAQRTADESRRATSPRLLSS
jgi:hypothetical protein